jgi:hypothetical protein
VYLEKGFNEKFPIFSKLKMTFPFSFPLEDGTRVKVQLLMPGAYSFSYDLPNGAEDAQVYYQNGTEKEMQVLDRTLMRHESEALKIFWEACT